MPVRKLRAAYWVDIRWNFRRYRRRSPVNTRSGAEAYEATLRAALARGHDIDRAPPIERSRPAFGEFARQWLGTYVRTNNKPSEYGTKRLILEKHLIPFFARSELAAIRSAEVERYKAAKRNAGLSAKTVNNHLAVLGKCLRTAQDWDLLDSVPKLRALRVPLAPFDFLSAEDGIRLLRDDEEPWRGMLLVGLGTGLRLGELFALTRSDVDFERRLLTVGRSIVDGIVGTPKNHRARHIPLTGELVQFFSAAPANGLLFPRPDGRPQSHSTAEKAIKRICRRVGLRPIGWHTLRHTFASDLVAAGVPLPAVKELLGHSSIVTTMRYAHLAPSALRGAIDALERSRPIPTYPDFGQPVGNKSRFPAPPEPSGAPSATPILLSA